MFSKLLIANRGEIACRVIATARRMGIVTVAVYSEADARARHVEMADEAVAIGPAPATESYLRGEAIIEAARATGAEAIHPGYGFLSENPGFVEAVEKARLVFVGPPASAIRAMGLKDAAKTLMQAAGVPVVPGYHGAEQNADFLAGEADAIGYPVLIKARAGGGGKGMRLVEKPTDFKMMLEGAQRESQASFGDPAVLVEKFVASPRHIEIQVFADAHGNVVHLFERDCSLQRRHQKVIEEAPAPGMPAEVREAMGRAAVEAARAVNYRGAGTVEFIADGSRGLRVDGFWFMEMNTRLQVEHPLSEAITGLDFVELQLRVAAGEPLPFAQDDLAIDGHAFEARVYAEDVPRGFLPATGRLEQMVFPHGAEFARAPVRIDSGVRQGDEISPWYDPMIAKLIVHGPTRPAALRRLVAALAACQVSGSVTNLAFLGALARHEGFAAGEVDTGLIGRDLAGLTVRPAVPVQAVGLASVAALGLLEPPAGADSWDRLTGWRAWAPERRAVRLELEGTVIDVGVSVLGGGRYALDLADGCLEMAFTARGGSGFDAMLGPHRMRLDVHMTPSGVEVFAAGHGFSFMLPELSIGSDDSGPGGDSVSAPMPGLVKVVAAQPGQVVAQGDRLIVLEAMKMEHTLTAPRDGVVAEVLVEAGEQVSDGMDLVRLEPEVSAAGPAGDATKPGPAA